MTPEPVEPAVAPPPPPPPTPLVPPQVFFAAGSNYPPRIVHTQEEADALDKTLWISAAIAPAPKAADEPKWPQIWHNVNVPPKIVGSAEEAAALGPDWRKLDLASHGLSVTPLEPES
jgi:hypothetical protein